MQLPTGVGKGIGEEGNVEVDEMNVGEGVGVTAGVSRTRSAGSISECTHSRMRKLYHIISCYYLLY